MLKNDHSAPDIYRTAGWGFRGWNIEDIILFDLNWTFSKKAHMWSVQHRTYIYCFQGIFQISNLWTLSYTFIALPCQKAFLRRKITKQLFWVPRSQLPEKGPFMGLWCWNWGISSSCWFANNPSRLYLFSELGCEVGAWILSAVCWVEMNAIIDFRNGLAKGKIYWPTLFYFFLRHFTRQSFEYKGLMSCCLIMSNRRFYIWRFLKWLTL